MNDAIPASRLRELFVYNPLTGRLLNRRPRPNARPLAEAGNWHSKGYREVSVDGRRYLVHRVVWAYVHGEWPDGQIDHINHNKGDNRLSNLSLVDNTTNHRNRPLNKNNTSGIVGVTWHKGAGKWAANICISRKNVHLGLFEDIDSAAKARKYASSEAGFHENHGSVNCKVEKPSKS